MSATFMGAVLDGQDAREAWEWYRQILREDPQQQAVVRQLADTEGGREMLEASRAAWRARGLEAPFDFLIEEEARA